MDEELKSLQKQSPEQKIRTLNAIAQKISSGDYSEEITIVQLKSILNELKKLQPAIIQATVNVVKSILNTNYPSQFPTLILSSLIDPLSNKNTSNIASGLIEILIPIMGPDVIWSILNKNLTTKCLKTNLIISILNILCTMIKENPNFRSQKILSEIKECVLHPNREVRESAVNVIKIMYNYNPSETKNSILKNFKTKAKDILNKVDCKLPKETPKIETESESENLHDFNLFFENAGEDIEPVYTKERLVDFAQKLIPNKQNNWEDRLNIMHKIVGMAKATEPQDHKKFAKELFMIVHEIAGCATDLRSGLVMPSCLDIVAIARILKSNMDACNEVLIPALLAKTSHGTFVIAEYSKRTVVNLIAEVPGRKTQKQIEVGIKSVSWYARAAVVEGIIAAMSTWPKKLQINLSALLEKAKSDKDSVVRKLASEALSTKTPRRSQLISNVVAANYPTQLTPMGPMAPTGAETPSRMMTPLRHVKLSDGSKTAARPSALRTAEEGETPRRPWRSPLKYLTLDTALANGAEELADFLEGSRETIFGYTKDCIDILIKEMNKEKNIAPRLAHILFSNYADFIYPFLTDIVDTLPDDYATGRSVIDEMIAVFGEPVNAILTRSMRYYAFKDILKSEEAVIAAVDNGCFQENADEIVDFVCTLYASDKVRATALITAMDREKRSSLVADLKERVPELAAVFDQKRINIQTQKQLFDLYNQMNYEEVTTMIEAGQPTSVLIKLVGLIGRAPFMPEAIAILMYLMDMEDGTLRAYAGKTLRRLLKANKDYECSDIAQLLSATASGFRCFLPLIKKFNKDEIVSALEEVKSQMIASLEIEETRIAVVEVVAALAAKFGPEYESFLGPLDGDNLTTLNFFLKKKYDVDEIAPSEISFDGNDVSFDSFIDDSQSKPPNNSDIPEEVMSEDSSNYTSSKKPDDSMDEFQLKLKVEESESSEILFPGTASENSSITFPANSLDDSSKGINN